MTGNHLINYHPIVFRYAHEKYEKSIVFRPRVEVRLKNKQDTFRVVMLVDSGADVSFIPLEIAEILNIPLKDNPVASRSASGKFETQRGMVEAELLKGGEAIPLGNLPILVPKTHLNNDNHLMSYALLGRNPFFKKFDILFKEKSRKIILYPRKKISPVPISAPRLLAPQQVLSKRN